MYAIVIEHKDITGEYDITPIKYLPYKKTFKDANETAWDLARKAYQAGFTQYEKDTIDNRKASFWRMHDGTSWYFITILKHIEYKNDWA